MASVRTGVVLAREAGALAGQREQFRREVRAVVLPGTQWFPWIHIDDAVGLITLAIDDPSLTGPLNVTAAEPVRYRDDAEALGRSVGRPARLPTPGWVLRRALGPAAVTVTHGRREIASRALHAGYRFKHPTLEPALTQLIFPAGHVAGRRVTPPRQPERRLRRACLALVLLLLLLTQVFLGMITNLYATLPPSHPGAHSADYFTGIVPGIGCAILHRAPELALHATLGILLAIVSLTTMLITARDRQRVDIALATVAAATLIGAGFNGASFVNYGHKR